MAGGPADRTGSHDLGGIYYAIVTQNDDKDGPGARVKVRFPWMPEGDRDQSDWAPLAVPMIGAEFGTYTVPEVEDTVLVMFVGGDIDHPIVVGGVWSEKDPPPEVNDDGKNNFRVIKSRAGSRVILDDSSQAKVVLSDVGDHHVLGIGQTGKDGAGANATEVAAMGASSGVAAVSATGTLNIWCPNGTLTVKGKVVEVTSAGQADVKGGMLSLKGTASATLSGTSGAKFQGTPLKVGG